jgi:transposase
VKEEPVEVVDELQQAMEALSPASKVLAQQLDQSAESRQLLRELIQAAHINKGVQATIKATFVYVHVHVHEALQACMNT